MTEAVRVVGTMSGTSLDGVDAAEIVTDGHELFECGETAFRPYSAEEQSVLRAALGKWQGEDVHDAAALTVEAHAQVLSRFSDAAMIGFHGQTVAHDPAAGRTHQIGDGAALALRLRRPVVWDFRSADMRMGGEGAPLAPFYHFALARKMKATHPLAILNLGGVGNLTWIDPSRRSPETEGALLAFDTGPANAPINDLMQARRGAQRDEGGALAATGVVQDEVIAEFLSHPYFQRPPPKSLDRDAFDGLMAAMASLSDADAAATLTQACAASVAQALTLCPQQPEVVYVTGGGRHNRTMMQRITDRTNAPVRPIEEAGFDGDMLEAQAFAFLAVRVARGLPTSAPGTTGVAAAMGSGTVSSAV